MRPAQRVGKAKDFSRLAARVAGGVRGRGPAGIRTPATMFVCGVKNIGFLSFGHWTDHPESGTRNASDALLQAIDLAVAAEELGADGAYFRVHHFAQQLGSPFPLLAAAGARTKRVELGTAVIDMRYEKPYLALHKPVQPGTLHACACSPSSGCRWSPRTPRLQNARWRRSSITPWVTTTS